jgi:hypothetical protein
MADLATLQTRLTEAESAYHKLAMGGAEEDISHGDMRTKYTSATMKDLQSYISTLKSQIVAAGGAVDGLQRRAIDLDLPG